MSDTDEGIYKALTEGLNKLVADNDLGFPFLKNGNYDVLNIEQTGQGDETVSYTVTLRPRTLPPLHPAGYEWLGDL